MSSKGIEQRIDLKGEKEYSAALKEAQRNLRTLKSELKAETAELGRNATEQQKAEAKAKSLKKQIQEQEKIVKTLRATLEEVKKKYGDNTDEVARWEQKLNNARATLGNMKNDLDGVTGGLKAAGTGMKDMQANAAQATVATKSVADALGQISSVGSSVSDAIEGVFSRMIETVTGAVEQLWDMISQTAAKANSWRDLGSYYGSSAQEMQMWSRSILAAGGDWEKFLGIVNKLSFGGKEKSVTELLGISKENYTNDIEYTLAVLDELENRKARMGQGWYDQTMETLFGAKKSADVSWFISNAHGHTGSNGQWINGWREGVEQWNGNETAYGMSDSELDTMADLWIKINNVEQKWNALKENVAAGFGMAALELLVNVEGTLDGLADYMNAENDQEREAALEKIRTNIEEFFRKLGKSIREAIGILQEVGEELQESDDPITRTIGDILTKLAEGLGWMIEHQEEVKGAFEMIFGAWLIAKLAAVAGQLSSILLQIEAIKAFQGLGAAGNLANAGGSSGLLGGIGTLGAGLTLLYPLAHKLLNTGKEDDWLTGVANGMYLTPSGNSGLIARLAEERGGNGEEPQSLIPLPDSKFNLSAEQYAAAEAFWDVWRTGNGDYDAAYAAFQKAFEGDEGTFDRLDDLMLDLMLALDKDNHTPGANFDEYKDLPTSWWGTTPAAGDNGITAGDLRNFNGLPAQMLSAVRSAVIQGMSGVRIQVDGVTLAALIAGSVSEQIARGIPG